MTAPRAVRFLAGPSGFDDDDYHGDDEGHGAPDHDGLHDPRFNEISEPIKASDFPLQVHQPKIRIPPQVLDSAVGIPPQDFHSPVCISLLPLQLALTPGQAGHLLLPIVPLGALPHPNRYSTKVVASTKMLPITREAATTPVAPPTTSSGMQRGPRSPSKGWWPPTIRISTSWSTKPVSLAVGLHRRTP